MTQPTDHPRQMVRLTPAAYQALEKMVPQPYIDNETTPIAAGYKLGVQAVLKALREGYVVDY